MSSLAYIPARGGSKGIKGKNKREMHGMPLVEWSILQAKASSVDSVVVSSDDDEILEIAMRNGVQAVRRAPHLATDNAQIDDAIIEEVQSFVPNPDEIVLLQPTSPLRRPYDIDRALEHFREAHADSLLSMTETDHKFQWERDRDLSWVQPYTTRPRRQDMPLGFRENGSIYVTRFPELVRHKSRVCGKIAAYTMEEFQGFEIDTETDWVIVEALMEKML